ncbi:MAG: UxaA family hydrolase [Thermaerobacter sp.]|nr:UxaA family hydrolase [Thermaerobacter sp.]
MAMASRNTFMGYCRANGAVGVRDYLLALPSVVCATRAAARAIDGIPHAVTVEHPVGCAQIGADREQTLRVLVGIGSHPNVRGCAVLGLGCEGVPAAEVRDGILLCARAAEVVTIQSCGGTEKAAMCAGQLLKEWGRSLSSRDEVSLSRLMLGIGPIEGLGAAGREIVEAFLERGGSVLGVSAPGSSGFAYGERFVGAGQRTVMQGGSGPSETITGLVASGSQIILAQADGQNLGGHPIAPVVRLGYEERLQMALHDDMDGMIGDRSAEGWVDWILEVASGRHTMAEAEGVLSFAISRVGPTL